MPSLLFFFFRDHLAPAEVAELFIQKSNTEFCPSRCGKAMAHHPTQLLKKQLWAEEISFQEEPGLRNCRAFTKAGFTLAEIISSGRGSDLQGGSVRLCLSQPQPSSKGVQSLTVEFTGTQPQYTSIGSFSLPLANFTFHVKISTVKNRNVCPESPISF